MAFRDTKRVPRQGTFVLPVSSSASSTTTTGTHAPSTNATWPCMYPPTHMHAGTRFPPPTPYTHRHHAHKTCGTHTHRQQPTPCTQTCGTHIHLSAPSTQEGDPNMKITHGCTVSVGRTVNCDITCLIFLYPILPIPCSSAKVRYFITARLLQVHPGR